jgi:hypothetical protein
MDPRKKLGESRKAFEKWFWRRTLKIKWTDKITNDVVFQRAQEDRTLLKI